MHGFKSGSAFITKCLYYSFRYATVGHGHPAVVAELRHLLMSDCELWLTILTIQCNLPNVKVNQHAKYLDQRSCISRGIWPGQTHRTNRSI